MFNLHRLELDSYSRIVEYIKGFNEGINLKPVNIAKLKQRSLNLRTGPKSRQSKEFIKYVKKKLVYFDEESFYKVY
jgi:hypothetical protein